MASDEEISLEQLDGEIAEREARLESLRDDAMRLQRSIQNWQEQHQGEIDDLAIQRARYQAEAQGVGPDRERRLNALTARQAEIDSELQRLTRDRARSLDKQQFDEDSRVDAEEQLQNEREELQANRAQVEAQAAERVAGASEALQRLDVQQAELQAAANQRTRNAQSELNEVNENIQLLSRDLENLRQQRASIIDHHRRESVASEAERLADERTRELQQQFASLAADRDNLAQQVQELAPVVEAQREATSSIGAHELGKYYDSSADEHKDSWKLWLKVLTATIVLTAVAGPIAILELHPDDGAPPGEIVASAAVGLLVVGLLVYAVRMASLQFRVHRHLEAVDRSKAAALKTYNGLVAGPASPEVRTAVAAVLAEAVFSAHESGFLEGSADQVTIVERIVGSAAQRVVPPT
ncbi:MAG: hypothetical protein QOI10_181 [Solirubrobacterales bacterium]|nr:hypothetical protein [Solirubrobacterales bacterium]